MNAFIHYLVRHRHLLSDEVADEELQALGRQRRALVVAQGVATGIALLLPYVAVGLYLLISVGFVLEPLLRVRRGR